MLKYVAVHIVWGEGGGGRQMTEGLLALDESVID